MSYVHQNSDGQMRVATHHLFYMYVAKLNPCVDYESLQPSQKYERTDRQTFLHFMQYVCINALPSGEYVYEPTSFMYGKCFSWKKVFICVEVTPMTFNACTMTTVGLMGRLQENSPSPRGNRSTLSKRFITYPHSLCTYIIIMRTGIINHVVCLIFSAIHQEIIACRNMYAF